MSEPSSLAYIVRVQTWQMVRDQAPLALFHKKFWGKDMKDEESAWRNTQPVGEGDSDQDGMNQGKDQDETTDVDDDIIPGCYVLDIGIPGLPYLSLWIRADYIRVYDFFQTFYNKYNIPMTPIPSAVLTGHPGIGKSVWIYYAARRCAAEMKPFIWLYEGDLFLFVKEGVYLFPGDWRHDDFRCRVWTLVDSDGSKMGVPERLIPHGTRLFVIYVTSPAGDRWSRMNKTTRRVVAIMNPWGREEIQRAARLSSLQTITEEHVYETFDLLGPIPRIINYSSEELEEYKDAVVTAISNITVDEIQKLVTNASKLSMDAVSHKLCLLSRQQRDDVHSRAVLAPITPSIQSRLSIQFHDLNRNEQIRLYKSFQRMPISRMVAGIFYEAVVSSGWDIVEARSDGVPGWEEEEEIR